jgi:hypothetical protein
MKTALRLCNYEDVLDPKDVYSLVALTSFYNQYYAVSSRAFIKLESLESLSPKEREVSGAVVGTAVCVAPGFASRVSRVVVCRGALRCTMTSRCPFSRRSPPTTPGLGRTRA